VLFIRIFIPFLTRDVIYTSRAYAMMPVRLSVFQIPIPLYRALATVLLRPPCCCGHRAARRAACGRIISRHAGQCWTLLFLFMVVWLNANIIGHQVTTTNNEVTSH